MDDLHLLDIGTRVHINTALWERKVGGWHEYEGRAGRVRSVSVPVEHPTVLDVDYVVSFGDGYLDLQLKRYEIIAEGDHDLSVGAFLRRYKPDLSDLLRENAELRTLAADVEILIALLEDVGDGELPSPFPSVRSRVRRRYRSWAAEWGDK